MIHVKIHLCDFQYTFFLERKVERIVASYHGNKGLNAAAIGIQLFLFHARAPQVLNFKF